MIDVPWQAEVGLCMNGKDLDDIRHVVKEKVLIILIFILIHSWLFRMATILRRL